MRNYIQINNVSKDEWSWFLQDNGHAALVRSIDNVSNSEPNLVPGLFYTCSMCRKMLLSRSGTFALSSVVDWYYWMECIENLIDVLFHPQWRDSQALFENRTWNSHRMKWNLSHLTKIIVFSILFDFFFINFTILIKMRETRVRIKCL